MTRVKEQVREVVLDHLLDAVFGVVDRKTIEDALADAYRRGVVDGNNAASRSSWPGKRIVGKLPDGA